MVLTFLSADAHDHAILEKPVLPELTNLCASELGLSGRSDQPVGQVRHELCRSLLLAEIVLKVGAAGRDTSKLVDMLRYEMGQELLERLGDGFDRALQPAIGQFPTITEVGMAALMPEATEGMKLVDVGAGLPSRVGVLSHAGQSPWILSWRHLAPRTADPRGAHRRS